jgi:hypothetical protein
MPIMRNVRGRPVLSKMDEHITKMSMSELVDYERCLWVWMDKTTLTPSADIVRHLNMIHREVEWRALEKDWNAAHP